MNDEAGTFGMTIHVGHTQTVRRSRADLLFQFEQVVEVYALTNEISAVRCTVRVRAPAPFPQRPSSILFIAEGCEGMVTGQNAHPGSKHALNHKRLLIKILEENAKRLDPHI